MTVDVDYTCPKIDSVIEILKDIETAFQALHDSPLSEVADRLETLREEVDYVGRAYDLLEDIRQANSDLRENWKEVEESRDSYESEKDDLAEELREAREEIDGLKREIADLERDLSRKEEEA